MSTPQRSPDCSMIMYVEKDAALLQDFLRDLRSFFAKFPVQYEIIAVVEAGAKESIKVLQREQAASSEKETMILRENSIHQGRARSLCMGLDLGNAPYLIIVNPEMATPLGDVFKIWQHLVTEEQVDLCWGDRYRKKDSPFIGLTNPRIKTEHFFNDIVRTKSSRSVHDPLCEVLGMKKEAWRKLQPQIAQRKIKGWYLGMELRRCPALSSLKIHEVPIHDSGYTSPSYSVWKERWNLVTLI